MPIRVHSMPDCSKHKDQVHFVCFSVIIGNCFLDHLISFRVQFIHHGFALLRFDEPSIAGRKKTRVACQETNDPRTLFAAISPVPSKKCFVPLFFWLVCGIIISAIYLL
jgi:hypothetical protein